MLARLHGPPGQRVRAPARMGETFDWSSLRCRSEAARTRPALPSGRGILVVLSVIAAAFILVLPVELPDKTLFATLVLATRFGPLPVFVGVGTAFAVQSLIAVTAGSLLTLLPEAVVSGVVAVLFLVGAVILWRSVRSGAEEEDDLAEAPPHPSFLQDRRHLLRRPVRRRVGRPLAAGHRRTRRPLRRPAVGVHRRLGGAARRLRRSPCSSAGSWPTSCRSALIRLVAAVLFSVFAVIAVDRDDPRR